MKEGGNGSREREVGVGGGGGGGGGGGWRIVHKIMEPKIIAKRLL